MKTSELVGPAHDWAVAKCGEWVVGTNDEDLVSFVLESSSNEMHFWPSTDWAQGGPIIERERIATWGDGDLYWEAECGWAWAKGSTPLIAAMRCYVTLKLGDEVEVPEELSA